MKNNNENTDKNTTDDSKIKPAKLTIRITETVGVKFAERLISDLDMGSPVPPIADISQIDLLLVIDHSDKEGNNAEK